MGFFTRLFGKTETRTVIDGTPDMLGGLFMLGAYGSIDAGVSVTPDTAMQAAAVYACVSRIARDIATLPRHVIDRDNGGRVKGHPVGRVLRMPNPYMTGASFWESYAYNMLLWGNGYASIERDDGINTSAMLPLMARNTQPRRAAGELFYTLMLDTNRPLPAGDVLHVPLLAVDGICGRSPISASSRTVGTAIALADFAARYFSHGSKLNDNAFELPAMTPEAVRETHRLLQEQYTGPANQHKLLAMPGLKPHKLSHSLRDDQALEARDFQLREVCRLFNMPVGIIDPEKSKYAGLEAQYADYAQSCLRPLIVKIEEELNRKAFTTADEDRYAVRFNLDAVVRADLSTRAEADSKLVQAGIITTDEARAHHDLPPVAGGGALRVPLNMGPAANPAEARSQGQPDERVAKLITSIAAGIITKEVNAARKAADKPDFPGWAAQWFAEHRSHVLERLPVITQDQADVLVAQARDAMVSAHVAGQLGALLDQWQESRRNNFADIAKVCAAN